MGAYAKAEPLYQQALEIYKKVFGPKHPATAAILNNLAGLYDNMGDYTKAEPLYQQAKGDYAQAEPLYQQALEICKKALGPEHTYTASSLSNLAGLYDEMGAYAKAEPLYQQALEIDQKVFGPESPSTAEILNNLGFLYAHTGDYAKAEPLLRQALQIFTKALGSEHPNTATALETLAFLKLEIGQIHEAKSLAQLNAKTRLAILSKILSFASEQQRLAYENKINPYRLFAVLNGSEVDLADAILRYKGVVLDSLIEDRLVAEASKESQDRDLVGRLTADKRQLGQLQLQTPTTPLTKGSRTSRKKLTKSRASWPSTFLVSGVQDALWL